MRRASCRPSKGFGSFELGLHPEQTRLIEFGGYVRERRRKRGQCKPQTFDYRGFTHCCVATRKGRFRKGCNPIAGRMTHTLKRIEEALLRRVHHDVKDAAEWLGKVVNGWPNYFAVLASSRYLRHFVMRLKRIWHHILRRRSQKYRFSWVRLSRLTGIYWAKLEIRHPWPCQPFAVNST